MPISGSSTGANVLPKETRNYVPIILAVTIMAKNPAQYGLSSLALDRPTPYDSVTIDYPVDLHLVADCVGINRPAVAGSESAIATASTPREGNFSFTCPPERKKVRIFHRGNSSADRLWWRYHVVRSGDTLASLARSYRTTAKSIASESSGNYDA